MSALKLDEELEMKFVFTIAFCLIVLTGCKTVAANMASNIALDTLLRPVVDLTLEGGKAAYTAIEGYWVELNNDHGQQTP